MLIARTRRIQISGLFLALVLSACSSKGSQSDVEALEDDSCYSPQTGHPTVEERQEWVDAGAAYAKEAEQLFGIPAAALVAMSNIEGGYGWTKTALNANNPFGWKFTSTGASGGRSYYVLGCQPAADPNNKYIAFSNVREAFLFVGEKLATVERYKGATANYQDSRTYMSIIEAVNEWVDGIADAGYNYNPSTYKVIVRKMANNYMKPSVDLSEVYNTYKFSSDITQEKVVKPVASGGDVAITTPVSGSTVQGEVSVNVSSSASQVKLYSRATGSTGEWYLITTDASAPFVINWVTAPYVPNGSYDLKAEAYNGATLLGSATVTVTVSN